MLQHEASQLLSWLSIESKLHAMNIEATALWAVRLVIAEGSLLCCHECHEFYTAKMWQLEAILVLIKSVVWLVFLLIWVLLVDLDNQ